MADSDLETYLRSYPTKVWEAIKQTPTLEAALSIAQQTLAAEGPSPDSETLKRVVQRIRIGERTGNL